MDNKHFNQRFLIRVSLVFLLLATMNSTSFTQPASAHTGVTTISKTAATWHVPGDYATIQEALNAATTGATILVAPGTYNGSLNFNGKNVTLQSQAGPASTAVTGNGATVVTIGPNGKIIGFDISDGTGGSNGGMAVIGVGTVIQGNIFENNHYGPYDAGAAIYSNGASPLIEGNIFRNNSCDTTWNAGVIGFWYDSSPQIINNIFEYNSCKVFRLGVRVGAHPQVTNNTIVGNTIGISVIASDQQVTQIYRNNILYQNNIGLEVISANAANNPTWENNLVFGNYTNYVGISDQTGTNGNISVDPQLYAASQPPYMLRNGSTVIDAGTNSGCPVVDFRGRARPRGSLCDIGAYEGYDNVVTSIVRIDSNPSTASVVHFAVTFLEPVTGVDMVAPFSDFALTANGFTSAAITAVSRSGDTYYVAVDTGSGLGSLRLDVIDDDTILDPYSLPLGGVGAGNGDFTAGEFYTIDNIPPTILSIVRMDPNPIKANQSVRYLVTFSEPVLGVVNVSNFALTTTGFVGGALIRTLAGSGSTYTVTVETGTGHGTIRLDIPATTTVTDLSGNPLAGLPYLDGESYTTPFSLMLPLIMHQKTANIYGYLSGNGLPMQGQTVELRFYNGSTTTTLATVATEAGGYYGFNNLPSLSLGQYYYVLYTNTAATPGVLWAWYTRALTAYKAGDSVMIGNFDIADIQLVSPLGNPATVSLPYTFQWVPRWATPSDSYELALYDRVDGDPSASTAPLGYVSGVPVTSLPATFSTGVPYAWEVLVYGPDGGFGVSYYIGLVSFNNSGTVPQALFAPDRLLVKPGNGWEDLLRK